MAGEPAALSSDAVDNAPGITLDITASSQQEGWQQPLAGGILWCDREVGPGATPAVRPATTSIAAESTWTAIYDGPGLVDGRLQRIRSSISAGGVRAVEFEDGERFLIAASGRHIERANDRRHPPQPATMAHALAAPLVLALALRDVYVLHASALCTPAGAVVALTAESGVGKSTLAAAGASIPGFARIADDLLPVDLRRLDALPHFPQLKLPPDAAYGPAEPPRRPLAALVELVRTPGDTSHADGGVALERLPPAAACLALTRATVANRLFDRKLLAAHFAAIADASLALPVFRLRYPSGLDRLHEPLAALARFAAIAAGGSLNP